MPGGAALAHRGSAACGAQSRARICTPTSVALRLPFCVVMILGQHVRGRELGVTLTIPSNRRQSRVAPRRPRHA